ncbi:hypothetical protein [Williamsia sterculiae]|uniref:Uncharacterized protein n=1 Tax=Williamsia sterculiae TaxID=1344003 RepID=A0A1N7HBP2_9NOCA|nr:hypothetical protein [Williamsia sterculiae]SIS22098.1 hypothetical protein SAMN05445060_3895 [Williamsia sterculiae]
MNATDILNRPSRFDQLRRLPLLQLLVAAIATGLLWAFSPTLGDLQAAIAREEAARSGVGIGYWFGWYGGVSPGSYSLIVPALSAAVGSLALLCLATFAIAALAHPVSRRAAHPTALSWAIVVAAILNMMSGRVTFAVGAAFALAALLLMQRRYAFGCAAVLLISGLASPLAPAFVGLAVVPFLIHRGTRGRAVWTVTVGAVLGVAVPFVLFGAPGAQGFPWTTLFWCLLIAAGAVVALTETPSRWIPWLAAVAVLVIFSFPNGVGSNISRFFCLVLPCVCLYFSRRSPRVLALALVPALVYAMFVAVTDQVAVADAGDTAQDYGPLKSRLLATDDLDNHRVEMVDGGTHAGSHLLGSTVKLARGWENQSDSRYNPIFYVPGALTPDTYRDWLRENAVGYVAVSSDPLRQLKKEAALVNTGLPYLTKTWSNRDWTLYRLADARPIVPPPVRLVTDSPSRLVVDIPAGGPYPMQIRPNRYLVARNVADPSISACVAETPQGWITIRALTPGQYTLEGTISVRGVLAEQPPVCG